VSSADKHVLVDMGLSGRETGRRLRECGLEPEDVSAIVVSHEHGDHCRGAAPFANELGIPVFITEAALQASGMNLDDARRQPIFSGVRFGFPGSLFRPLRCRTMP